MTTLYFKTAEGSKVGTVKNVPPTGGGLRRARWALQTCHYIEITEAEYIRLKAELERKARGQQ